MKHEMGHKLGGVMSRMLGMMGQDPKDILTDAEIQKLLSETFKKFDKDNSGLLELPEFVKAWKFLGLKGSDAEINRSFSTVDTDGSGKIDIGEFSKAIKGSRAAELSLTVLLTKMDGELEGM